MTGADGSAGLLTAPAEVTIDDRALWWRVPTVAEPQRPPERLLDTFCDLAAHSRTEQPRAMADFARQWGCLELCKHRLPQSHNRPAIGDNSRHSCTLKFQRRRNGLWVCEPIRTWQRFTAEAARLVRLIDHVAAGEETPSDFRVVFDLIGDDALRVPKQSEGQEESAAFTLDWCVERWLKLGDVRLRYQYRGTSPTSELSGDGLFGALAVQLAAYTTRRLRGQNFIEATCTECGRGYLPPRKPRYDRDNYCPDCGIRAAWKNAQRRRRNSPGTTRPRKREQ